MSKTIKSIRMDDALIDKISERAKDEGVKWSKVVNQILRRSMSQYKSKQE